MLLLKKCYISCHQRNFRKCSEQLGQRPSEIVPFSAADFVSRPQRYKSDLLYPEASWSVCLKICRHIGKIAEGDY
jgi:hypothetical protein